MILAIHYDIALDKETRDKRKSRAKFHIAMVHKAPFDAHHRAQAQRAAYNRHIQSVPDKVWQPNELREEVLGKGLRAIVEYLDFDPGCMAALEDVLRLQVRLLRTRLEDLLPAVANKSDYSRLIGLLKRDGDHWRPYFDQLVQIADELDGDIRQELCFWYRTMAQVARSLNRESEAIPLYEAGVAAGIDDEDDRRCCVRELMETMAYVARERVLAGIL